jgi:hypothetical protein
MSLQSFGRVALAGGAGALSLTLVHETARRLIPVAPRMDVVAIRGMERILRRAGRRPPPRARLHPIALVGDLISNAAYYALVGLGRPRRAPLRGAALGLLAGAGALLLPARIGLGAPPRSSHPANQAMTLGWYVIGGIVAGTIFRFLARPSRDHEREREREHEHERVDEAVAEVPASP